MYMEFEKWLDRVVEENRPIDATALCFNLYEESDYHWSIQLIGSSEFDEDDEDWACDEVFSTGEDLFTWKHDTGWEEILDIAIDMIRKYLEEGKYADELKSFEAVATGFVDGDITVIYKK